MRTRLTKEDIKELKYSCRIGILLPLLIFLIGSLLLLAVRINFMSFVLSKHLAIGFLFVLCISLSFLLLKKLILDIYKGEKVLILKKVTRKEYILDYEPGSGLFFSKMRPVDIWYLIIDNYRYPINAKLYNSISDGDEVYMHYAPLSKELLRIEKKN